MKPHLNVSIEEWVGAQLIWDYQQNQWNLTGPMKEVLDVLSKNQFTYTLIRAIDRQWGILENNSWTGVMGLLDRNESDLALGPIALTYHRSLVSPFTSQLFSDEMSILSFYSRSEVDIFKPLSQFLDHYLWLFLLLSILVFGFVSSVSNSLPSHHSLHTNNSTFKLNANNLLSIDIMAKHLRTLILILLLRGNGLTQNDISSINRLLIILISMTSLFLTTMMSALIGMSVITGPEKANIDSLEELLEQDITPVLQEGSYQKELFINSTVNVYYRVWQKLKNNFFSLEKTSEEMFVNNLIHKRSVIIDGIMHLNGMAANICKTYPNSKLYFGRQTFLPTQFVLMTSKKFNKIHPKFHEYFNRVVLHLVSSGVFNEIMSKVLDTSIKCKLCKQDYTNVIINIKAFPFKLFDLKNIFNLFNSLMFLSLFILFLELYFTQYFSRNRKKKK